MRLGMGRQAEADGITFSFFMKKWWQQEMRGSDPIGGVQVVELIDSAVKSEE